MFYAVRIPHILRFHHFTESLMSSLLSDFVTLLPPSSVLSVYFIYCSNAAKHNTFMVFGSVLSHGLPCFVHGLNMFLGFHPQRGNAEAALVNFLQGEFISKHRRALIRRGCHGLHTLVHDLRGVQEAVALISGLQTLCRPHEVWNSMHWCSVVQGRR